MEESQAHQTHPFRHRGVSPFAMDTYSFNAMAAIDLNVSNFKSDIDHA